MFCPQCKAEYRQGFSRCADCDIDLVYELPRDALPQQREPFHALDDGEPLRTVWKCKEEKECVALCRELLREGIEYRVVQIPESRYIRMEVDWRYEIAVQAVDYERAREVLGIDDQSADGAPAKESVEHEAGDEPLPQPDDSPPDEPVRNDSYLKAWYPEDATVEVWSGVTSDFPTGVELALKENLIHSRSELYAGQGKVFVMPEDEARAREIVREIIENSPPGKA
jgi:hypothetical protein